MSLYRLPVDEVAGATSTTNLPRTHSYAIRIERYEMEWLCIGILLLTAILATIAVWLARLAEIARKNHQASAQAETNQILNYISAARLRLSTQFSSWFLVQPCFRCLEFKMKLLTISPNARSIEYQCEVTHQFIEVRLAPGFGIG